MWVLCKCGFCKFGSGVNVENVNLGYHRNMVSYGTKTKAMLSLCDDHLKTMSCLSSNEKGRQNSQG